MASIINAALSGGLVTSADTSGVLQLQTASITAVTVNASQNVGIGTTSPAYKLQVVGSVASTGGSSISVFGKTNSDSISNTLYIQNSDGSKAANFQLGTSGILQTWVYGGSSWVNATTIDSSGNVGIGTSSPSSFGTRLTVSGAANVYGDERKVLAVIDTTSLAAGVGAGISFFGVSESGGGVSQFGSIKGIKENATTANYAGALAFVTSNSANAQTERMRIDSSGNLLVGTTTTTGSASNTRTVAGGIFKTVSGSVSAATSTATTLFTVQAGLAAYLVTVNVDADTTIYSATYLINTQGGSSTVATQIFKGANISVSVSGYDVRATQTSGAAATIQYSAVRIF